MRKEVLYAVIFGIILGGIILFGINLANKSANTIPSDQNTPNTELTPTPSAPQKTLEIISPQNHDVISDKATTITGKTSPNTNIAITTESDDLITQSSPDGTFSAQINLIAGENTLTVTHLLGDNSTESLSITIIQSSSLPE